MSDWVGLFFNYETVGKKLKPHKTETLNRIRSESEKLNSHLAVIQINSTYLELIDRWNFLRGFTSIFALFIMGFMSCLVFMIAYFVFLNPRLV
ncbi:hypothetical protein PY247_14555 [Acinetobacter proteolyticus]|nr:hypothetical protein [Acinetobacter proteolyticus]WEI17630.1 hypothetical protein PY247_14555 [Acinetobacter proteolyticus]